MYYLAPLFALSGALAAAQEDIHDTTSKSTLLTPTLSTSVSAAGLTKTIIVTVTHTLYLPSSSHFAIPHPLTHGGQLGGYGGAAGPRFTKSNLAWPKYHTGVFAECEGADNVTGMPMFTLNMASAVSTSVPFAGHYTPLSSLASHSSCPHRSSLATSSPTSAPTHSSQIDPSPAYATPPTPTSLKAEDTVDILPIPTELEGTTDIRPSPSDLRETIPIHTERTMDTLPIPSSMPSEAEDMMSTLPISSSGLGAHMPGFKWPTVHDSTDSTNNDNKNDSEDDKDEEADANTAWSGTDNAVPAQMHDRSLPWLSPPPPPPPLQSTSAAVRRIQRFWEKIGKREDVEEVVSGKAIVTEEKRDCKACEENGRVLCRGDVAIGVCRGGCEELQFLGRGQGNGCEDE